MTGRLIGTMGHREVEQAVAEMVRILTPHVTADWHAPAGALKWDCWTTAAHVAHDLAAYAIQLTARRTDCYLPLDVLIRPGTPPDQVLRVVTSCGRLLSHAVATAEPDARAWHWGLTDPSGFAALGVNETLVHTYDIAQGLTVGWLPPASLSEAVLTRLFPCAAPAGDPARTLLWCTGRTDLPGLPRRTSWVVRAAVD